MKRLLKGIGMIVGGLLVLVIVAAMGLSMAGISRINQIYEVEVAQITVPDDEGALARGEHLVDVFCRDCHTAALSGQPFFDDPAIGLIHSANITGLGETHSDEELVLAIRHGLRRDGRAMMIMPSETFIHFSEEDLGAIIAYLKTVPRVGKEWPEPILRPVGRILVGAGLFNSAIPATYIDHQSTFPAMAEVAASSDYGAYLARLCQSCHGAKLAGGQPPDPGSPPVPDLTPAGALGAWSEGDFLTAMRTGSTPEGRQLNPEFMPWSSIGKLDDDELRAVWMYLASLPPSETAAE